MPDTHPITADAAGDARHVDQDALRALLHQVLDERSRIPETDHRGHHEWIRQQIERDKARSDFWRSLAAKSLPAVIWSAAAALAGWLWHTVRAHVTWS